MDISVIDCKILPFRKIAIRSIERAALEVGEVGFKVILDAGTSNEMMVGVVESNSAKHAYTQARQIARDFARSL